MSRKDGWSSPAEYIPGMPLLIVLCYRIITGTFNIFQANRGYYKYSLWHNHRESYLSQCMSVIWTRTDQFLDFFLQTSLEALKPNCLHWQLRNQRHHLFINLWIFVIAWINHQRKPYLTHKGTTPFRLRVDYCLLVYNLPQKFCDFIRNQIKWW